MHEKKSFSFNYFGSQRGSPVLMADLLELLFFPDDLPPTVARRMKEAVSTNILLTSSLDLVFVACSRSLTYALG